MSCQSRYIENLEKKRPVRTYFDSFVLNTGFILQADLLFGISKKISSYIRLMFNNKKSNDLEISIVPEKLYEGDKVRVKSLDQIIKTLNLRQKMGGCYFIDDMDRFCGGEYIVQKKVNNFFDELSYSSFKTDDVVLLKDVHCTGKLPMVKYICDRSCLYFWKEAWLEKITTKKKPKKLNIEKNISKTRFNHSFHPGDKVRIISKEKIQSTLNKNNHYEGCLFMDEMWNYCGKEFVIDKNVDYFFNEKTYAMAETKKKDIVTLKNLHCLGNIADFNNKCDRHCLVLWKADWLEKI